MELSTPKEVIGRLVLFKIVFEKEGELILPYAFLKTTLFSLILPAFVFGAASYDGTFRIDGVGVGLFEHYGLIAMFVTTPIIIVFAATAYMKFHDILSNIETYTKGRCVTLGLKRIIDTHLSYLSLETNKSKAFFALFLVIGIGFVTLNVKQTIEPVSTYGNDVFDSVKYFRGFLATKIYYLFLWGFVYPVVFFLFANITYSLRSILKYLYEEEEFKVDLFHHDNCGGTSNFGIVDTSMVTVYLCLFIVMFLLQRTHSATYFTLIFPAIFAPIFLLGQSYLNLGFAYKAVKKYKEKAADEVATQLNNILNDLTFIPKNPFVSNDLLSVRKQIQAVNAIPYANNKNITVFFYRFGTPLAVTFFKKFSEVIG